MASYILALGFVISTVGIAGELEENSNRSAIYSPVGKRDPFRPPASDSAKDLSSVNPLEKHSVEKFQLKAILKGIGRPRAMFEDPDGRSFILNEGDTFGREKGTISRILDTEVIVTERTFNYLGAENLYERVLSLPTEESLNEVDGGVRAGGRVAPSGGGGGGGGGGAAPPPRATSNAPAAAPRAAPAASSQSVPFQGGNVR